MKIALLIHSKKIHINKHTYYTVTYIHLNGVIFHTANPDSLWGELRMWKENDEIDQIK